MLGFGMAFADLYRREGLVKLDQAFLDFLHEGEAGLHARLDHARAYPDSLDRKAEAALLIEIAPWMEDFIARLFGIEKKSVPWPPAIIGLLRFIHAKDSSCSAGR